MAQTTNVAPLSYALFQPEDLARYMRLSCVPVAEEGDIFNLICNSATTVVERYCNRPFVVRSFTDSVMGLGTRFIGFQRFPVDSISSVDRLNSDFTVKESYTSTDFWIRPGTHEVYFTDTGRVWANGSWYTINYDAGLNPVPSDVVLAGMKIAARAWRDKENNKDDITSQTLEGQTVFYNNQSLGPKVRLLLSTYRVPF